MIKSSRALILFQVKGGSARIDEGQEMRLFKAIKKVEIAFNWSEKPRRSVRFHWDPVYENFESHIIKQ